MAIEAPSRMRDAVPLRFGPPRVDGPVDAMIVGLCPNVGEGIVRLRWWTRRIIMREFLVQRGLPGEIVTVTFGMVHEKAFPRGELDLIIDKEVTKRRISPYEIRTPCKHYETCGGCDFLNLKYGRQLVEKQRWVEKVLVGTRAPPSVLKRIRPSEPQSRYAHRTEWFFTENDGVLSFGPTGTPPKAASPEAPVGCLLPPRSAARLLAAVFDAFLAARGHEAPMPFVPPPPAQWLAKTSGRQGNYSVYEEYRGFGLFKSVEVFCARPPQPGADESEGEAGGRVGTELLLNFVVAAEVANTRALIQPLIEAAVAAVGSKRLVGVVANVARAKWAVMGGRRELLLYGRRHVCQAYPVHVGGGVRDFVLHLGAGSKLPTHSRALPEFARVVLELCALRDTDVVWHCFCGGGALSLALGAACEHVVAIGASAADVSELKRNLAANEVCNTTAVLTNLRSPWALRQLSVHISQSQQQRLLIGTGEEQEKARDYAIAAFVPGESRRRQMQRLSAAPFTAPLLRQDALAHRELRALLPAFVRDFRDSGTTLPVPLRGGAGEEVSTREVPPEMESRLKRLYRRLALKYHPDKNPDDPEASDRFQALTRAYKALVGDSAGPEEGDDDVEDPFLTAMSSSYKAKQKDKWREDGTPIRRRPLAARHRQVAVAGEGDEFDGETTVIGGGEDGGVGGLDDGAVGDRRDSRDSEDKEEDEVEEKMEIDISWASPPPPPTPPQQPPARQQAATRATAEIVLREGANGLEIGGDAAVTPTLPPPDVIVVSQPLDRVPGRGTKRHFHTWLRSTAARAIVYIAADAEAFRADVKRLTELGYELQSVQPFDPEPHRRSLLLAARLELIRPLAGAEEYSEDGIPLLRGADGMLLPPSGSGQTPLLGSGGYRAIPAIGPSSRRAV